MMRGLFLLVLISTLTACQQNPAKTDKTADLYVQLGIDYLRQGDFKTALEKLEHALSLRADHPKAHNTLALLYGRLNRPELAEKHYRIAIDQEGDQPKAHNNFGTFLCSAGRYDEGVKHLLVAAEDPLYSGRPIAYSNIGVCYSLAGDHKRAEVHYRKALQINPYLTNALQRMAELTLNNNNYLSSRAYIERFLSVTKPNPKLLWIAVRTERALGDRIKAGDYARLLKGRFPDSDETGHLLELERDERKQR